MKITVRTYHPFGFPLLAWEYIRGLNSVGRQIFLLTIWFLGEKPRIKIIRSWSGRPLPHMTRKRIVYLALLALIVWYSLPIAWSIASVKTYVDYRLQGETHETALCDGFLEFADNILRSYGLSDSEARSIQRTAYKAYCERI